MSRDRWFGLSALAVMFALGLVCGLWIGQSGAGHGNPVGEAVEVGSTRDPDGGTTQPGSVIPGQEAAHHEAALRDLRQSVGLDDEQMQRVHEIFARNQGVVRAAWRAVQPEIEIAMEKVHREVADLLEPEQRRRYHDWLMARRGQSATAHGGASTESSGAVKGQSEPRSLHP